MSQASLAPGNASAISSVLSVRSIAPAPPVVVRYSPGRHSPGNDLRWNITAPEILQHADIIMSKSKAVHDTIAQLSPNNINYDTVIKALAEDATFYYTARLPLYFIQHVSADKDLRKASWEAEKKLTEYDVELSMREDAFNILLAAQKSFGDTLKPEAKRYLERMIALGKRNGLHLAKIIQAQIRDVMKSMEDLISKFVKNLADDETTLVFTSAELDGLPKYVMRAMEHVSLTLTRFIVKSLDLCHPALIFQNDTSDGRYKVPLKGPYYLQCMKFVRNPDVRMLLETAFNSRCMKENTLILENLLKLRHQRAKLLSFPHHAAYVLDMRMAKTPERVTSFLYDLQKKLQSLKDDDIRLFLQYKREDCEKSGREFDNKINLWDTRYYMTRVEEKKYAVDHKKLRNYFPLHIVKHGLLEIYQELLSLKFELIEGAETWHPEVNLYSVKDKIGDKLIGYFYMDLLDRDGKYDLPACFCLQPSCNLSNGTHQLGIAAIIACFSRQTADKPPLLTHDEVETFFHEFGHVMHQICADTEFVLFSGANVEKDFVETPSQMLENWCWERETLMRMSAHHKDGTAIPNDLMNSLVNSRRANGGFESMWQVLLSKFDQAVHSTSEVNTAFLFEDLIKKIIGIDPIRGTSTPATFVHLVCGYDAQYYSYLWSEVYSTDMFYSRFKKEGLRNAKAGMDYRSMILKPGGSMDADQMIHNFLGRELNPAAFFIVKGFNQ